MTGREPVETTNLDIYGDAVLPWSRARDELAADTKSADVTSFVGTVKPDGTPHAAGVGVAWVDDELYFTAGPDSRKARNLAENPAATMSVRLSDVDVVLEGEAERIVEPAVLERLAAHYRDGGWPAEVDGDGFTAPFSAPSAGPPPWHLYRLAFHTAFGVATAEPYGATRWRFES